MKATAQMSWNELEEIVGKLRSEDSMQETWKKIEDDPLSTQGVDYLARGGWKVYVVDNLHQNLWGICEAKLREIRLNDSGENYYQRDKILFHELVHAHYGEILTDGGQLLGRVKDIEEAKERRRKRFEARGDLSAEWIESVVNLFGDFAGALNQCYEESYNNSAIVEWLARQYRADPQLLRHTLQTFHLPIHVYDKVSYLAVHPAEALAPEGLEILMN